ncbi:MAG: type IV pilus modification protein PilV [Methylomonas sp.]|jgi:type IV pilus assembly protein PilV
MPLKSSQLQLGFTLLEVLVSLIVMAVGLLGVASLQVVAINNTSIARNRTLAALQVNSLASMMHANSAYWQSATSGPPSSFTVTLSGSTVTINNSTLNTAANCLNTSCSASGMAAYDVQQWGANLSALPGGSGLVSCVAATTGGSGNTPAICTINVSWSESNVALDSAINTTNTSSSFAVGQSSTQTFSLIVQP